jgi:alpha-ketoglutarate-dependent taurine dioxygenase
MFIIKYIKLFLIYLPLIYSFRLLQHPLEKRIAYIYDINDIKNINEKTMNNLYQLFNKHPLLIFKNLENVSPQDFINFLKKFDKDHDSDALKNPDKFKDQMLQPFDQFPDCKHVAPRGNVKLKDYYNIKDINIKPSEEFINNYVWHTDILGHEYKLPNVITGFYIVEQPQIGGDTDFISGETIYENLSDEEQIASGNILIEINRRKFITKKIETDYAGISRLENYEEVDEGNTIIPLVFAPDSYDEQPRILLLPTFFEKVVGWNIKESRLWIKNFMINKVLPHRISIQWKKGDLAVFNNRRFMHSSTPARNYLDNQESSKRLLLQTFIPTNRPLLGIKPLQTNNYACYNVQWIKDQEKSIISADNCIKFSIASSINNNEIVYDNRFYILINKRNNK